MSEGTRDHGDGRERVAVLANASSGAGRAAELAAEALAGLEHAGHRLVGLDCRSASFVDQLKALEQGGYDVILAIGGDGSVSAAAGLAVRTGAALAVVPAGTMNMVAGELGFAADAAATVAALRAMGSAEIDYASVNGRVFLHSTLLGVVPRMARSRERARDAQSVLERLRAGAAWGRRVFKAPTLDLELASDAGTARRRTRSLTVTNNPLRADALFTFERASLTGGVLGVYASAHTGAFAAVRLAVSFATGGLARDPETLSAACRELLVKTKTDTVAVSADGEVVRLETPLRFMAHPRGLRVLVPVKDAS